MPEAEVVSPIPSRPEEVSAKAAVEVVADPGAEVEVKVLPVVTLAEE